MIGKKGTYLSNLAAKGCQSAHESTGPERQARWLWDRGNAEVVHGSEIVQATESVEQVPAHCRDRRAIRSPAVIAAKYAEASIDPSSTYENVGVEN
jgi:hypothetical protein